MALERLNLDGQVAIVTGGGRGVGRGVAMVLAEAGATVVVSARTQSELDESVALITAAGGKAISVRADVMVRADLENLVDKTIEACGRIDIVVNNAGGGEGKAFADLTEDDLLWDFKWNVVSTFSLTQLAAPHMRKTGGGSVVNISSRAAEFAGKGRLPYGVAKAGLEMLTKNLAQELAPDIRVNAIALGMIDSPALRRNLYGTLGIERDRFMSMIPSAREGWPEDIGLTVLYLAAKDGYANGSVVVVDGALQTTPFNYISVHRALAGE